MNESEISETFYLNGSEISGTSYFNGFEISEFFLFEWVWNFRNFIWMVLKFQKLYLNITASCMVGSKNSKSFVILLDYKGSTPFNVSIILSLYYISTGTYITSICKLAFVELLIILWKAQERDYAFQNKMYQEASGSNVPTSRAANNEVGSPGD